VKKQKPEARSLEPEYLMSESICCCRRHVPPEFCSEIGYRLQVTGCMLKSLKIGYSQPATCNLKPVTFISYVTGCATKHTGDCFLAAGFFPCRFIFVSVERVKGFA
jgi:hypothetical protein